jgi:class 3 adenylate cyclase
MANLDLIKRLNEQYEKSSPIRTETRMFAINEAIDSDRLKKALTNSLASMGPLYAGYFDLGLPAKVALLFIDVCSFSTRFSNLDGEKIAAYFDKYYDVVIPIIYKYGGEIDKIIGDGIICIFGPPFLSPDLNRNIKKANDCAKEIIKATEGKGYSSKVAFHCGTINYFKNKTGFYKEFTMIGKPLTEIFRLESVSLDERVNYYGNTEIRSYYEEILNKSLPDISISTKFEWTHCNHQLPPLKGVDFTTYHSIKHNK